MGEKLMKCPDGQSHGDWYGPGNSFCGHCGTCGRCYGTGTAFAHRLGGTGTGCRHCWSTGRDPSLAPVGSVPWGQRRCLAHGQVEPCGTCAAYIAGGQ